jgi:hypothetical protein
MDGRILSEAMTGRVGALRRLPKAFGTARESDQTTTIKATRTFPSGTWRQSLQISRVDSTIYLDEGNGAFVANEPGAEKSQGDR